MCLAVPSRIIEIREATQSALVDVMGARREVSLMILPEQPAIGEYVLVHAGFAIQRIDEAVALDSLRLIREYADSLDEFDRQEAERVCGLTEPKSIFEP